MSTSDMDRAERRRFARTQTRDPAKRKAIERALKANDLAELARLMPDLAKPKEEIPPGVSQRESGLLVARPTLIVKEDAR